MASKAARRRDFKVSISYESGYKAAGQLTISGPNALDKARLCADIIWKRLALDGIAFPEKDRCVEYLGAGVCHAGIVPAIDPPEVVLRIGVKAKNKAKVNRFGMEIVPWLPAVLGVTGFAGGRPGDGDYFLLAGTGPQRQNCAACGSGRFLKTPNLDSSIELAT
jgi:hypothetical protein